MPSHLHEDNMNFILFNGPPRSGKDTAAKIAWEYIASNKRLLARWEKFSMPHKQAFAAIIGAPCDGWGHVQYFEDHKEEHIPVLGDSFRGWQISFSEKYMKPVYGESIFGRLLLARCAAFEEHHRQLSIHYRYTYYYIVSDCGFQVECDVLKDHNVLLFQMVRDGCTFKGDSRQIVAPHANWLFYNVNNNGDKEETRDFITKCLAAWIR